MIQDRYGKPLKVGDKVSIPCTVTAIGHPDNEFNDIQVTSDVPTYEKAGKADVINLKAKQVELR